MADLPHFNEPFGRVASGAKLGVVEQDTDEHVLACEFTIVACPLGFRNERPEFGWPWPLFANAPLDLAGLEAALRQFEPRSRATASELADAASEATRRITIEVEGGQ